MEVAQDPFGGVASAVRRDRRSLVLEVLSVAFGHVLLWAALVRWLGAPTPTVHAVAATEVFDVEIPKPSPPPPPPPPTSEPLPPEARLTPSTAAAAPARAAAVLVKESSPSDPLDLTGDGFVIGSATSYSGGQTAVNGTNVRTVQVVAPAVSAPPPPVARVAPAHDQSRSASIVDGTEWKCPFPAEADSDHVDVAIATVRVSIDAQGGVKSVDVVSDPGHGFGREAKQCAMSKHWVPALDQGGQAIEGTVTVRVRFDR